MPDKDKEQSQSQPQSQSQSQSDSAVAIKIPPFWARKPKAWFAQVEAQFALRGITVDETRYYHVAASLDNDVADRVSDLLEAPPVSNKYTTLKERLVESYSLSKYEQACLLLNSPDLGDDKPSILMSKMLAMACEQDKKGDLFRALFLCRLPEDIRGTLIDSEEEDCRKLAQRADRLWSAKTTTSASAVIKLPTKVANQKTSFYEWRRNWKQEANGPCSYHTFFGKKAKRCEQPCSFITKAENSQADRK